MKLLHVIGSVNPAGGGPIEGILQLATVNRSHGHEVEIACLDDPRASWVKTCHLPCHALGPGFSSYRWSSRLTHWVRANAGQFNAIIINGIWHYNSYGTWRALRNKQVPYFVYIHGMLDPWFKQHYPLKHFKKWLAWRWTDFRVLRDARAVLFTSLEECRLAYCSFRKFECRPEVVQYGSAGSPLGGEVYREQFLEKFPILRESRNFLFLGRIHEKKGIDLLLRAFAEVVFAEERRLVVVGPDNSLYAHKMKILAQKLGIAHRIFWTGMLSGALKWGAFHHADAFVLPSHQENFGIAVVEALSCGLPVLISKGVNIWREIVEDRAGFAVENDQATIASLLKIWAELFPSVQNSIRVAAYGCFERRFHAKAAAASLIQVIQKYP